MEAKKQELSADYAPALQSALGSVGTGLTDKNTSAESVDEQFINSQPFTEFVQKFLNDLSNDVSLRTALHTFGLKIVELERQKAVKTLHTGK